MFVGDQVFTVKDDFITFLNCIFYIAARQGQHHTHDLLLIKLRYTQKKKV